MSEKQIVWHAYHYGSLCQLVDLEARRAQIEKTKPEHELPTRRRLMKPVVGELPIEFVQACIVELEAWGAWGAWGAAWNAWEASYQSYKVEIERLHAIECPGCPWDGETIFPKEVVEE